MLKLKSSKIIATKKEIHEVSVVLELPEHVAENLYHQLNACKYHPNHNREIQEAIRSALGYIPKDSDGY